LHRNCAHPATVVVVQRAAPQPAVVGLATGDTDPESLSVAARWRTRGTAESAYADGLDLARQQRPGTRPDRFGGPPDTCRSRPLQSASEKTLSSRPPQPRRALPRGAVRVRLGVCPILAIKRRNRLVRRSGCRRGWRRCRAWPAVSPLIARCRARGPLFG